MMRKEFRMSARELFTETPAWEVDVLLAERESEIRAAEKAERDAARKR